MTPVLSLDQLSNCNDNSSMDLIYRSLCIVGIAYLLLPQAGTHYSNTACLPKDKQRLLFAFLLDKIH